MGALISRSYANYGTSTALNEPEGAVSFAELRERVHRVGNALTALGVHRGDRVVIWLENCREFLEVEHAAFLFGFVRTALASRLHPDEVVDIVRDCSAKVVITGGQQAAALSPRLVGTPTIVISLEPAQSAEVCDYRRLMASTAADPPEELPSDEDLAVLLYTSGTTGRPKGAMLSHRNWVAMVGGVLSELPPVSTQDTVLHAGPMSHLSGSVGTACYVRGARTAMLRRFEPTAVLQAVEELGITILPLVPTMLAALTNEAERGLSDLSSLRAIPYGGSAASPALLRRAQSVFGDVLVQLYGLSEALVPLSALSPADHRSGLVNNQWASAQRLASAGRPGPFVDVRIRTESGAEANPDEAGEIQVRSDTTMVGYWGQPGATAEIIGNDGWVHTGDIGYRDSEGYLYVIDRKSDVIVSGGFNIYPTEVELAIHTLPQVDEVVVVGAPHDRWGETVTAVVTLKAGQHLTESDVVEACRAHLADYKKPTRVMIVQDLPKNSSGKLLRRDVRAQFWAGRERPAGDLGRPALRWQELRLQRE